MTKKINKIVVFYDDGTFEEIKQVPAEKIPEPPQTPFHTYPPGVRSPEDKFGSPGFYSYKVTCSGP